MYDRHEIYFDLNLVDTIGQFIRNTNYIINGEHACQKHLKKIHFAIIHYLCRGKIGIAIDIDKTANLWSHLIDITLF